MKRTTPDSSTVRSSKGEIDVSYGISWTPDITKIFVAAQQLGLPVNPDVNSRDPIGMGMGTLSCYNGKRITAAGYLANPPTNLTTISNAQMQRLF